MAYSNNMHQQLSAITRVLSLLFTMHQQLIAKPFEGENGTERPVIAILGQLITNEDVLARYPSVRGKSYIAASYVKFVEAGGARVLPISDRIDADEVREIFKITNGVIFPGGVQNLLSSRYARIARQFFELAQEAARVSDIYPVLGICLGMQQLAVLASKKNLLKHTDATNIGLQMKFSSTSMDSNLFGGMPPSVHKTLTTTDAAFNNHEYGVLVKDFLAHSKLNNFFKILTSSQDRNGTEFVAAMEAKSFPIFGLQWHPEKTLFEWKRSLDINHDGDAVYASQYIANTFVQFAKQSRHHFLEGRYRDLVYVYTPLYTGDISSFQQIYVL